ncbi:hypothetical protein MPC38_00480 [Prescottella equi]|uniref:hypothetical protein n=1 Tax=Rhodococcus hoagii TaxID=43767 RepID=UPI0009BF6369|nr:hypothetical protein [Prescottella equi]MBM4589538.1 hypothetical protein [Prescottella equi]MBM4693799.1 hypothetical protein [Prescottella equi]MBM4724882.1 hypothetical protein [Prescottella equi]NKV29718.1 hypothetical protein [Prescottella equi]OQQ36270.1 hypothetical protein A6409_16725 [Prescottella equi]
MRKATAVFGAAAVVSAVVVPGSVAGTAMAATDGATDVTFTVGGQEGPLELFVPRSAPMLWANGQDDVTGTVALSGVRDRRSGTGRSVTVSASISDVTNGTTTIPRSAVTYTATGGTMGFVSTGPQSLDSIKPVVGIARHNWPDVTFLWTPSLRIDVSDGVTLGNYSATLTHSAV